MVGGKDRAGSTIWDFRIVGPVFICCEVMNMTYLELLQKNLVDEIEATRAYPRHL